MIDTEWMWGEWLETGQDVNYMSDIVMKGDPEVGTAFDYMNLNYMAQMAEILGEDEDQQYYKKLAEKVKSSLPHSISGKRLCERKNKTVPICPSDCT